MTVISDKLSTAWVWAYHLYRYFWQFTITKCVKTENTANYHSNYILLFPNISKVLIFVLCKTGLQSQTVNIQDKMRDTENIAWQYEFLPSIVSTAGTERKPCQQNSLKSEIPWKLSLFLVPSILFICTQSYIYWNYLCKVETPLNQTKNLVSMAFCFLMPYGKIQQTFMTSVNTSISRISHRWNRNFLNLFTRVFRIN